MDANSIAQLTRQLAGDQGTKSGINDLLTSAQLEAEDGTLLRVQCVLPPASAGVGSITIRKSNDTLIPACDIEILCPLDDLWDSQHIKLDRNIGEFEGLADRIVKDRLTVLISGGTSSGKTTALKALLSVIPKTERIITIEDVPELEPNAPNLVTLITDRDSSSRGPKALLAAVLRMRPDRLLLGELRGDEARVFIEAVNTGHDGSMSTIHANSAPKAINRLVLMALGAAPNLTASLMIANICDTIDLVIQVGRQGNKRGITGFFVPADHQSELVAKFRG